MTMTILWWAVAAPSAAARVAVEPDPCRLRRGERQLQQPSSSWRLVVSSAHSLLVYVLLLSLPATRAVRPPAPPDDSDEEQTRAPTSRQQVEGGRGVRRGRL